MDQHHHGESKKSSKESLKTQKAMMDRLSRVEGQIRGIKNLIEKDTYCYDVINQIEAARSALGSISMILMESHLRHCIVNQLKNGDEEAIDEILKSFKRMMK